MISNIAEGQVRNSEREFVLFLSHAKGSLVEVETQIFVAENLHYIRAEVKTVLLAKTEEVGRLIAGLSLSLREKSQGAAGGTD